MRPTLYFVVFSLFARLISAAFGTASKNNVVTYWGQGANQGTLLNTCQNSAVDIVNIAFLNVFPDQGPGGLPGTNFGNACGSEVYTSNGRATALLRNCPLIGPHITQCQRLGKKVFLSLGGQFPGNNYIRDDNSARAFATFLWGAFGPVTQAWRNAQSPRPFGDAVIDGFDFDIESNISPVPRDSRNQPINDYRSRGYSTMINYLRNTLYPRDSSKRYYIAGSPQCIVPDAHLGPVIQTAWFDFLFIQFYNTDQCSARAGVNRLRGTGTGTDITFNAWNTFRSLNSNVKILIGLPGSTTSSGGSRFYLRPDEVYTLANAFFGAARFGGISVWEATASLANRACGNDDYLTVMRQVLNAVQARQPFTRNCAAVSSTTSTTSTTSSSTTTSSTTSTTTSSGTTTTTSSGTTTTTNTSSTNTATTDTSTGTTTTTSSTTTATLPDKRRRLRVRQISQPQAARPTPRLRARQASGQPIARSAPQLLRARETQQLTQAQPTPQPRLQPLRIRQALQPPTRVRITT